MTEQNASTIAVATERKGPATSQAIFGPLTARDLTVLGAVLVIFVASVLPLVFSYGLTGNMWSLSGLYFLGIGVVLPLVVGALFGARRMSPEVKMRVGSLSIDQFASVVAGFATAYFFLGTVSNFLVAYLVGLVGSLILLAATVLAPWIPLFASDFANRAEVPAHPVARDAVPARRRPAAPKAALALPAGPSAGNGQPVPGQQVAGQAAPFGQYGQPAAGAPGFGFNGGNQPAAHTPAGQIFTPAGNGPTPHAPFGAAAATTAGDAVVADAGTGDAAAQEAAGSTNNVAAAGETASDVAVETATAAANEAAQAAPETRMTPAAPAVEAAPGQGAGVVPSPEAEASPAPETMLNPKVAEAAPSVESIGATVDPQAAAAPAADPFWFAVDRPQNVVDERTRQFVFKLTPGSWILALEDRGSSFLVQDSHGKTGILLDLVGIERAPEGQ